MWNIRRKAVDIKTLRLSPEEGFVLSRLDAPLSMRELVSLTGLEEARVVEIVEELESQGALELDRDAPPPPAAPATTEVQEAEGESPEDALDGEDEVEDEETEDVKEKRAAGERELHKIYDSEFAWLERDARVAVAEIAEGSRLAALCLDPDPLVIHAVMKNARAGLEHARLVAFHHRTQPGLDAIARRNELLADAQVQKRLLSNPRLADALLRRIVSPKLLTDVYKIVVNRETPETTRKKTRELLQKKFMLASADERAALIVKTDGRCLISLVNVALDARTTQILCGSRTLTVLFIQNCARWSASPPALLAHMLKQPLVRQNIGLKRMLLKHPNTPSEAKRALG